MMKRVGVFFILIALCGCSSLQPVDVRNVRQLLSVFDDAGLSVTAIAEVDPTGSVGFGGGFSVVSKSRVLIIAQGNARLAEPDHGPPTD